MKKKLLCLLAIGATSLSLSSCNVGKKDSSSQSSLTTSSENKVSSSNSSSDEYGKVSSDIKEPELIEGDNYAPYEIYPNPHNINYLDENIVLPFKFEAVIENNIDQATKDHLYSTLAKKNINISLKDTVDSNKTQILVGVYNSNGEVDKYVEGIKGEQNTFFEKIDSYYLSISQDKIVILGKDTDACFYGITTLSTIFDQTSRTISNLELFDYSDCTYRGFIEGYYGIPWTRDERIDLMEFGSQFKTNIYIYAPKDDAYHSSNWRGLYTESDLLDLKEQIAAGERTKTRFAWSIHPFINKPITLDTYEEGYTAIINKFEQLYTAGVRQFVVSADDISVTKDESQNTATLHNKLLNDVNEWCLEKGDCYDLIFVPAAYHLHSADGLGLDLEVYYQYLCDDLDENIQIMWTGNSVCSSVSNGKFDEFKELSGRTPFMWMNWPVTDYSEENLLMGKAEVLDVSFEEGETPNFTGIVTNPMQQPEQSKLSIFAIADYCWNINDFDMDKSYEDSMKFVEPTATEAFHKLCTHLSNASLFEERWFEESEEFKPFISIFESQYNAGVTTFIDVLTELYQEIVDSADEYLLNATNIVLRDSMKPWIDSLKLLAEASILYLKVLNGGTNEELGNWFDEAETKRIQMNECKTPILNKIDYGTDYITVKVSESTLLPFLNTLQYLAADEAYISTGRYSGVTYKGFEGVYEGELNNIIDGNLDTYCWFNGYPEYQANVRVDLGEVKEIRDIHILQGNSAGRDFMNGDVEVSSDGRNFTKVGELSLDTLIDLRLNPVNARYIRLVCKDTDAKTWVAIKEVEINTLDSAAGIVTYGNIEVEDPVYGHSNINHMIDGDESTFTWFRVNEIENAYIILDLLEVKKINNITLHMANETSTSDYFHNYSISISSDGTNYETIGEYEDAELDLVLNEAKEARYIKITALETDPYGIIIREFSAN